MLEPEVPDPVRRSLTIADHWWARPKTVVVEHDCESTRGKKCGVLQKSVCCGREQQRPKNEERDCFDQLIVILWLDLVIVRERT